MEYYLNEKESFKSVVVPTKPYQDQKPGTSGLRKPVTTFQQRYYTANFVQSILNSLGPKLNGCTLVVGGDGRFYGRAAIDFIVNIAAANKVRKLIIGHRGIFSTPAVSCVIRKYNLAGGIILTASHNPGGPDDDFGIKFNVENGGPAPDAVTNHIYELTKTIKEFRVVADLCCHIDDIGFQEFEVDGVDFTVEIVDPVSDYLALMKEIFDFPKISALLKGSESKKPFNILIDSMNGVTGPYVKNIFVKELGASMENVVNVIPMPDFGGLHPDPNLTYAKELVDKMATTEYDLGAAFDGDGDRHMILSANSFFVNPSDALAVLADNLDCIPYFQKSGVKGFARSMPTSSAIDRVANAKKIKMYQVPTGWKYFGNLMDADSLSLCGEESFGCGSDHIREKDGIWAVLAWLSIIQHKGMSIKDIVEKHWKTYGRNYFRRYDFENYDAEKCKAMMARLEALITEESFIGKKFGNEKRGFRHAQLGDNFEYTDPIDKSVTSQQGLRILFTDGSRIIFRLSGTGSSGATVRVYFERYAHEPDDKDLDLVFQPLIEIAWELSDLEEYVGTLVPTVIT